MSSFWNQIKNRRQKQRINSSLDAHQLAEYYRGTMGSDNTPLTPCQCQINNVVRDTFHEWVGSPQHGVFTDRQIDRAICALRKNVSAGIDGISAEYFIYGNSEILRSHLLATYNSMFNRTTVPSVLITGIIIPILKKSTLDPNIVNNFRPITLGSTHGKLIEFLIMPADMAHPNQFGFRKGRGTAMACNYLNDLSLYCKSKGSPLYICSLDAEKCFDTIWHEGLFYKLLDILPRSYWLFLYKWYKSMECIVRWDGSSSQPFKVYRGTRQGSILSPSLFNVFINDLLIELSSCTAGVRLDRDLCNSFAYADDITVFGLTVPDLQKLIDTCYDYSQKWRFAFGASKTVCMISGNVSFIDEPNWFLGTETIQKSDSIEILGTVFSSSSSSNLHVNKRIQACRRAMYGLTSVGCCYPGLSTDVKAHLYKIIGLPSLLYGIESVSLNQTHMKSLECAQSNTVKNIMGFNKRSHHSNLLHAVRIDKVETSVIRGILSLWYRIYQVDNSARALSNAMLRDYVNSRHLIPGTLIHRVVEAGFSPIKSLSIKQQFTAHRANNIHDGIVDSLRHLVYHENFVKPYSEEHILATLLVKAF